MSTPGGETLEMGLGVPAACFVASHRPAGRLWIQGKRREGTLEEEVGGVWSFRFAGPHDGLISEKVPAKRLELELCADSETRRLLGVPRFQVRSFEMDAAQGKVRWRPHPFEEEQARLFHVQESLSVSLKGASILDRVLAGEIEALSPYEVLLSVHDLEHLLFPGAIVALEVPRPWGALFALYGRIDFLERRGESTRLYLRLLDRRSVQEASLLAACECPGFGTQTMWTYGLPAQGLDSLVRVRQAVNAMDMVQVFDLRRAAHQFQGLRPEAGDWQLWADPLDEAAILLLISLGTKPVATGRLVVNHGDRGKNELERSAGLPSFLWEGSFVEFSQMAIHPAFRGVGLRLPLFREAMRLTLALGCRFIVFAALPKLVPSLLEMGALPLDRARPAEGGEPFPILYLDLRKGRGGPIDRIRKALYNGAR